MPTLDFSFDLANLIGDAVRVLIILVTAFIFLAVLKKVIPRTIKARLPKPRETSPEQLEQRADTISLVITKTIGFVVWVIAFMMIWMSPGGLTRQTNGGRDAGNNPRSGQELKRRRPLQIHFSAL